MTGRLGIGPFRTNQSPARQPGDLGLKAEEKSASSEDRAAKKAKIISAILAGLALVSAGLAAKTLHYSGVWANYPISIGLLIAAMVLFPIIAATLCLPRPMERIDRLRNRPDSEVEQIVVRITLVSIIIGFICLSTWRTDGPEGLIKSLVAMCVGTCMAWLFLIHIIRWSGQSTTRRMLGIFADQLILSYVMASGGQVAAGLYLVYLWVTFGNGFRYGVRFLIVAALASALGFSYVILTSDYWSEHIHAGVGLLIALLVLPAYVMPLIGRLNRARAQAEEANRSKGRFLATMSHELRTPLTAIIGMGGLLKSTSLTVDQRGMVAAVDASAQSLLTLINEILDFSKIESGKLALDLGDFDLHEVFAKVWMILHGQAEQKGLRLRIGIDTAAAYRLSGDAQRFSQVLINLVGNAVKFTEHGEVELSVQSLASYSGEVLLRFEVKDTGIGIPDDKRATIFEGFTQADDSISRRFGGTGLGLAISKQLVEAMGGQIGVESAPGVGSTFWLTVPFEIAEPDDAGPIETRGASVMLVSADQSLTDRLFLKMTRWLVEPVIVEHLETLRSMCGEGGFPAGTVVVVNNRAHDPLASAFAEMLRARKIGHEPAVIEISDARKAAQPAWREWPVAVALIATDEDGSLHAALHATLCLKAPWASAGNQDSAYVGAGDRHPVATRKRRILLAEDNNTNRLVITRVLTMAGHEVIPAADGDQAIELLATERLDIAFMDVNMPGTSGLDVVKMHRLNESPDRRLPIVALTADATTQARRDCADAGMDDYLTKPIEPNSLYEMINRLASGDDSEDLTDTAGSATPEIVTPISRHPRYETVVEPVVDSAALDALRTLDTDGSFFVDVVSEFLTDSETIIDDLEAAADKRDVVAFKDAAHSLRSSANHVGASRMVKLLFELRDLRPDELRETSGDVVKRLRAEFGDVRAQLNDELAKQRRSLSRS